MQKIFCVLSFFCIIIFSSVVFANDAIVGDGYFFEFIKNLDNKEHMSSFVQTKTFLKYNKNFVVTGSVKFVKDIGLIWKQKYPKKFQFIATKDEYCFDNNKVMKISVLPYIEKIKDVIDDVIVGNYDKLYDAFNVVYEEDKNMEIWKLQLFPKYSKISDFIKSIQLSGNKFELLDFYLDYVNDVRLSVVFDELDEESFNEIKC